MAEGVKIAARNQKAFHEYFIDEGGKEYAELCALAYRQSIAAHMLVEAPNGDLLWLSKENNSNCLLYTSYPEGDDWQFLYRR